MKNYFLEDQLYKKLKKMISQSCFLEILIYIENYKDLKYFL